MAKVGAQDAQAGPVPSTPAPEPAKKFQSAISQWRTLDFTTLVGGLDTTASDIITYQRDSTVQRKDLAQKTKDWRKLDDANKLSEIKGLLKAYQIFIDLLASHSKVVNAAFLQAYTALSDAPDPYPLLEASVDSMLLAEDTLPKLTEENHHLQQTVTDLTSQLEGTESKLQTERAARRQLEDTLDTKVREVEATWKAVLDEKQDNWEAKGKSLEDRIENQDRLLTEIKASYEVNQRLGLGNKAADGDAQHGEARGAMVTGAELEMVNLDLERTSARLAEVEARNEQLRLELAQAKSQAQTAQTASSPEDDPDFMRMRSENSSLIRKLDAARVEKEAAKRDVEAKLRSLEREVGLLQKDRDALKTKVHKWSDYEDVKQELEVLKSIEFSTGDDDDDGQDGGESAGDNNPAESRAKGETLEQLLLSRNKKLGDELTILRLSHQDLQKRLQDLQEGLSRTNADLEKAQNLNEKLENELSSAMSHAESAPSNLFPSGASVAGTYVSRYTPSMAPTRRGGGGGRTSPTSSIISGLNPRDSFGAEAGGAGGGTGILPMVTAQRDRFKKRNAALEQELSESHRTMSQLRQEVAALQRDNLNLYEKTRYVSTYNRVSAGGGAGGSGAMTSSSAAYAAHDSNPLSVSVMGGGSSSNQPPVALDRYRKAYESNLSPFAQFRGREAARAYRRMSIPERAVYSIMRMVLATRASRNLFAAYCVALHLLVFCTLYWLGTIDVERHTAHLSNAAVAAAAQEAAAVGGAVGAGKVMGGRLAGAAAGAAAAAGRGASGKGAWQEEGFGGN